jgi:hypothetical protein
MFKITPHEDWYEDGIEGSEDPEQCWRLDPPDTDIQVQLFAVPVHWSKKEDDFLPGKSQDEWKNPRLFIEYDVRGAGSDGCGRIRYACDAWTISDEFAEELLEAWNDEAVDLLRQQIDHVMALPNQPDMCES